MGYGFPFYRSYYVVLVLICSYSLSYFCDYKQYLHSTSSYVDPSGGMPAHPSIFPDFQLLLVVDNFTHC